MLTNATKVLGAEPDSQYRLLPCKCGSDNVAYVQYASGEEEKWRVCCFDCGQTVDTGTPVRHDAQTAWNRRCNRENRCDV